MNLKRYNLDRPKVTVNMVISLDGKISTRNKASATFSSDEDFHRLLQLRRECDVLLVGRGTLETDEMSMTVPAEYLKSESQPLRCVLSRTGAWNLEHKIFHSEGGQILLAQYQAQSVEIDGAEVLVVSSLGELLQILAARGFQHVHCEGGGELLGELFAQDLVDELYVTWAGHICIGGQTAPTLTGVMQEYLSETKMFTLQSLEANSSGECFLKYVRSV